MANTYLLSDESKHYLNCYYQILDEMIQAITTARLTQSISHNFIVQVIPHHLGAVRLTQNALRHEVATPLPPLLRAIADTQRRELRQIQALLQRRGCQAG